MHKIKKVAVYFKRDSLLLKQLLPQKPDYPDDE